MSLKKIFVVLLSFIVVFSLSLTALTSGLSKITDKNFITETALDTVLSAKQNILKKFNLKEEELKQGINLFCSNQDLIKKFKTLPVESESTEFIENIEKLEELGLSCDTIKNKEIDDILKTAVPNFINNVYEKDYDCDYLDCITKDPMTAMETTLNKKGHSFFMNLFWIFLIISLVILIIIFFLSENKLSGLRNIGINLIISGITFIFILIFKITALKSLIPSDTEEFLRNIILNITTKIINIFQNRFLLLFILGIIFIGLSIGLKYIKPVSKVEGGIVKE